MKLTVKKCRLGPINKTRLVPAGKKVMLGRIMWAGIPGLVLFLLLLSCTLEDEFKLIRAEKDEGRQVMDPLGKVDLTVVFTGSTKGDFEPCGCGGVYEGGFARRSTVIETIRKTNPNLLLLDTGDITSGGAPSQTEFTSQAYHLLGYDAIALGEGDLRVGLEDYEKFVRRYSLPIVISNLKFKSLNVETGRDRKGAGNSLPGGIREVITLNRCGRKIAVISVVSDQWLSILPMAMRKNLAFERPGAALVRLVPKLRPKYDMIILLSHLGPGNRQVIENRLQGIDLWIDTGGHQWTGNQSTTRAALTAKSPRETSFLLDRYPPLFISWQNDRKVGIAGLKWRNHVLTVSEADMINLAKGMVEDKRFLEIYDAYKYISRQEMQTLLNKQLREANTNTQPAAFQYVPSEKCGTCHQEIMQFWRSTKHGQAFATLKNENRDSDVNCWSCHSTGFREQTGFQNPVATPKLVDVGCQSCHRKELSSHPGKKKDIPPQMVQIEKLKDNLTQSYHCERCHVRHRSPNYEFKSYLNRIACPQVLKKK